MARFLSALAALLLALTAAAQERVDAVKALLDEYREQHKVVGIVVAIADTEGHEWQIGSGHSDKEKGEFVSPDTLFRLGSISKPVTAIAALKLVEQGKLSLFSSVSTCVPEWPDKESRITLRHLLTHTSGIRHYVPEKRDTYFRQFTVAESLDVFKDDPVLFQPGERVSYSTHAFSLVARMVETASGEGFGTFLKANVSGPAGAGTLALEDRSTENPYRSQLYGVVNDAASRYPLTENISWKSGGGGMESSAPDLARFGLAAMTGKLLSPQLTDFMFQNQVVDGKTTDRGLGWGFSPDGHPEHGGAQQGCRTLMVLDRKSGTVFVIMTNTSGNHPIGQLMLAVMKAWNETPLSINVYDAVRG